MDIQIVRIVRVALSVLSDRLLSLLALAMSFTLAAWVMESPDTLRAIMAGFFALCVYLPALLKERQNSRERHSEAENQ